MKFPEQEQYIRSMPWADMPHGARLDWITLYNLMGPEQRHRMFHDLGGGDGIRANLIHDRLTLGKSYVWDIHPEVIRGDVSIIDRSVSNPKFNPYDVAIIETSGLVTMEGLLCNLVSDHEERSPLWTRGIDVAHILTRASGVCMIAGVSRIGIGDSDLQKRLGDHYMPYRQQWEDRYAANTQVFNTVPGTICVARMGDVKNQEWTFEGLSWLRDNPQYIERFVHHPIPEEVANYALSIGFEKRELTSTVFDSRLDHLYPGYLLALDKPNYTYFPYGTTQIELLYKAQSPQNPWRDRWLHNYIAERIPNHLLDPEAWEKALIPEELLIKHIGQSGKWYE